jgi:hypothetical protein
LEIDWAKIPVVHATRMADHTIAWHLRDPLIWNSCISLLCMSGC